MNKEELIYFIQENMESDDFTGGVDEKQIEYVQNTLEVQLPESYKWGLLNESDSVRYKPNYGY
ncbi:hypothetical protein [Heyndrickxia coagulans]|uniref:Knr4/Smi1-like domain-containing protein n=1 Tax=Heyndrickxia coagulans 36D1 TaxID=345219 RepID=G2TK10_HEYCO|nr:hypothetical protein [Heyndrickxia coagulans]AEP01011.1 hypothetical protein Bcoa_1824 [Heyndrickxia coagulans 36D1]